MNKKQLIKEGRNAFKNGNHVCPYPKREPERKWWWTGYIQERTDFRLNRKININKNLDRG